MEQSKNLNYYMNLHYKYEIHQDDEGTCFIEYPELKGCMSCGGSIEEAIEMGKDAKRCWIETALKKGITIPEPK